MRPINHARKFYGRKFWHMVSAFAAHHYLYSSPTAFVLARLTKTHWWIEYAAGDIGEMLAVLPEWRPAIAFNRRGKRRVYHLASLVNKLLPSSRINVKAVLSETAKDGSFDPLLRRGWRREGQAAETTCAHAGSRELSQGQDS